MSGRSQLNSGTQASVNNVFIYEHFFSEAEMSFSVPLFVRINALRFQIIHNLKELRNSFVMKNCINDITLKDSNQFYLKKNKAVRSDELSVTHEEVKSP